jgi:hypothetical protein
VHIKTKNLDLNDIYHTLKGMQLSMMTFGHIIDEIVEYLCSKEYDLEDM